MADTFQKVADKYRGSPAVVALFIMSVLMLIIGINNFAEDTYSSYLGLKSLETDLGLNVQIFSWSYWAMSLAPQIASIVFFYMFMSTGEKKYAVISIAAQFMDFFADAWYRSNGSMFTDPKRAIVGSALTFIYFSMGSEFFVTVGIGLVLKLFGPALREWKRATADIKMASGFGGSNQSNQSNKGNRGNQGNQNRGDRPQFTQPAQNKPRDEGDFFAAPKPVAGRKVDNEDEEMREAFLRLKKNLEKSGSNGA